jgi:TM2 domain-containing membrane protein YozV
MKRPIITILLAVLMGFLFPGALKAEACCTQELPPLVLVVDGIKGDTFFASSDFIPGDTATYSLAAPEDVTVKKRIVSALLALPFPFGFIGAHRVMLGCKPWVPVVYIATFGGCFGLLPLIDFCVIVFSKDLEQYENNSQLFMWVK